MLCLTRKVGERVRMELPDGTFAWIKIVKIDGGKVVVGFDAPPAVRISREELLPPEERYGAR